MNSTLTSRRLSWLALLASAPLLPAPSIAAQSITFQSTGPAAQSTTLVRSGTTSRLHPTARRMAPPRGVYCSCPPTNAMSDSVLPSLVGESHVDGFLVRIAWKDLEPARGVFDFTRLQEQLDRAAQHGKGVALAVVLGSSAPTWLAGEGVQMVTYDFFGVPRTIPAAWDPAFRAIWSETIAVLGAVLAYDRRVSLVHVTNSSHNGFEMQLPISQEATFAAAGYTDQGYADSWIEAFDHFAAAFPLHPLDVEVHPVFGRDQIALDVTAHGLATLGGSFGAFAAWWSVDNAALAYPGMFAILSGTAPQSFGTVQIVGSWVTTPERFDHDLQEYLDSFTLAQSIGVHYAEVWNADLLEPSLRPFFDGL